MSYIYIKQCPNKTLLTPIYYKCLLTSTSQKILASKLSNSIDHAIKKYNEKEVIYMSPKSLKDIKSISQKINQIEQKQSLQMK